MKHTRNTSIDFLRGLAVLVMIVIHVTAYYLNQKTTFIIWDYIHFVVPIFAFCSAYIYFQKDTESPFNFEYVAKRAKRLLIPYYIFLVPFFGYFYFLDRKEFTARLIQKYLFLIGDRDLNWLVILFIYFIFLLPFIRFLSGKKHLFLIFVICAFASSIALMFTRLPVGFRIYMWLPWSTVLIFAYMVATLKEKRKFLLISAALWLTSFLLGRYLVQILGKNLVLTENKYPPNLYYLSYGMFWICVWYLIHSSLKIPGMIQHFFDYLSNYAYSLFFIHFLYLYIIISTVKFKVYPWWLVSMVLVVISIFTQVILNKIFHSKKFTFFRR